MGPFDIIKVINEKGDHDKDEVVGSYNAWVINRGLSNMMDTLFFAQEMNKAHFLDKDIQFDFYFHGVPRGKRYGKWYKEDTSQELLINNISNVFCVNKTLAKRYLSLLSENDKQKMLELEGGK